MRHVCRRRCLELSGEIYFSRWRRRRSAMGKKKREIFLLPHPFLPLGELDARLNLPLTFITCGSAGDGKSMLLCQLLHPKPIFNDQLPGTGLEGKTSGTIGGEIDLVSPLDRYEARCETGLADEVAYRHLEIKKRTFLSAETAGGCKFARELATAASAENLTVVLIDSRNATVGAGIDDFPIQRAENVHWQAIDVNKQARSAMKRQRPSVLWFTGLSGSGKSTIANALDKLLHARGKHTYLLDGDNVRHGLNHDLGFTEADRVENIRRVAEVAKLMADAGLIVIVSLISPFRDERRMARELMNEGEFIEIFVDTPLEECAQRDPKGLYEKAFAGKIKNFTGVSAPYEVPENPDLHLKTVGTEPAALARRIEEFLERRLDGK